MHKALASLTNRIKTVGRIFIFLKEYRLWWMIPLVSMLLLLGMIFVLGQSTPLGPLIYTIF